METYAGIDLHSSNNFIGVINDKDKILYGKRHANRLDDVLRALDPFKDSLYGLTKHIDPSVSPVRLLKDYGGYSEPIAKHSCQHSPESIYIVREIKSRRYHAPHCIFGYKHR